MKFFGLLLLLVLSGTALLTYYNWHIFIVPQQISLGYTNTEIPFGLAMLAILIIVTALFLMNMVFILSSSMFEVRRHIRELNSCKELAEKAESSRFTELKHEFEAELSKQSVMNNELKAEIIDKVDQIETKFKTIFSDLENTLDAYIGEFEDRLERNKFLSSGQDRKP